jgi:hypothetical protein
MRDLLRTDEERGVAIEEAGPVLLDPEHLLRVGMSVVPTIFVER